MIELEKEIEREVLEVESREKKREERMRYMGICVWCRKKKRKKKETYG